MRSLTRPPAEWKHTHEDEAPPRKRGRRNGHSIGEVWPSAWMGRPADSYRDSQVYIWDEFLNDLGRKNRSKGRARAVGSIALTYVSDVEMTRMLLEKFDKYNSSPKQALEIQRKIAQGMRQYIRNRKEYDIQRSVEQIALQRAETSYYITTEDGLEVLKPQSERVSSKVIEAHDNSLYQELTLTVSGIALYGKNKLALDLTDNEALYSERDELVGYLRSEGFNTSRVIEEWSPHAVVYDFHNHISSQNQIIKFTHGAMPEEMVFLRPIIGSSTEVA